VYNMCVYIQICTNAEFFLRVGKNDWHVKVLKDLNVGVEVDDADVDAVLLQASNVTQGAITKPVYL